MNRDLRRSVLLAVPIAAAALSIAIAGQPAGPPTPDPGGVPAEAYTLEERETARTQLRDSVNRLGDMLSSLNPGAYDQAVGLALFTIEDFDDEHLSHLLANGAADVAGLDAATKALSDQFNEYQIQIDPAASPPDSPGDSPGFPEPQYSFLGDFQFPWPVTVLAFTALNAADALDDSLDFACQQTVPIPVSGGCVDTSTVCIGTVIIKQIAAALVDYFALINADVGSWDTLAALDRSCHIHNDLLAVTGALDAMDAKLNSLLFKLDDLAGQTETLRETSCEHIRLVQLPQKQRASDLRECPQ